MFSKQDLTQAELASNQVHQEMYRLEKVSVSDDPQSFYYEEDTAATWLDVHPPHQASHPSSLGSGLDQETSSKGGHQLQDWDWLQNFQLDFGTGSRPEKLGLDGPATQSSSDMIGLGSPSIAQQGLPRRRSRYLRGGVLASDQLFMSSQGTASEPMDPMQRWRNSPPETESVSMSAIASAIQAARLESNSSLGSSGSLVAGGSRAASITSFGSGTSQSSISAASDTSAIFQNIIVNNHSKFRGRSVTKRRGGRFPVANRKGTERRVFPCTFCCDTFSSKYDWARHERSLHLCADKWTCTPNGGTVVSETTGRSHCAYCNMLDPTPHHLSMHNHDECHANGQSHTFSRKDHLVQHLRLVHQLETMPIIEGWKARGPPVVSRCGFCDVQMLSWEERVEHLAQHFRKGLTMDDWKGEHCFEPSIVAQVTNALPPYLLASESRAPIPFSVTNPSTMDQLWQIQTASEQRQRVDEAQTNGGTVVAQKAMSAPILPSLSENAFQSTTFSELLTLYLARYAQEQMMLGVFPTDEMFQSESRRIIYGTSDPWDQTMADNDDWLAKFRSRCVGADGNSRPLL